MKNGGPEYKRIAEQGQILRVRTGSVVHGISTESSDRDEVGVCIPPPDYVLGLRSFEQYQYRDAAERTGKFDAPSEAGDLDLTVYSLQKFVRLALNGNPSMLRLGMQGRELLSTGRITLPMVVHEREFIGEIRQGKHSLRSCLHMAELLEAQIKKLTHDEVLPDHPDRAAMDEWLKHAHLEHWEKKGLV